MRLSTYAEGVWDIFIFEKNLQGDITAVYDEEGTLLITYEYDAWGNHTIAYHNGASASSVVARNPFRYRGYYYDDELDLYWCGTRFYDSKTGRWINADSIMSGVSGDVHG